MWKPKVVADPQVEFSLLDEPDPRAGVHVDIRTTPQGFRRYLAELADAWTHESSDWYAQALGTGLSG